MSARIPFMSPRPPYPVVVVGHVALGYPHARNVRPLSSAKQYTLAMLVAAGSNGVDASSFRAASASPVSVEALRMAITRLREHLPRGALPGAAGGRYRLALAERDVDAWHLASMLVGPLPEAPDVARLRHLLRPVEPFAPLEGEPSLASAADEIRRHQRELLERLAAERPELLRGDLIEDVYAHLAEDPYNERLLLLCGWSLARSGHRRDALNLIARARHEFHELGLDVGSQLVELEQSLLEGRVQVALDTTLPPEPHELPRPLTEQLTSPLVGPDDHVAMLQGVLDAAPIGECAVVTVDGRSGVGKTRACAEVARYARSHGWRVLYAAPTSETGAAFGPLLAVLPGLADAVSVILDRPLDPETRKAALWTAALRALDDVAGDGRTLLILDDCQWLDPYTADFVVHLADRRGGGRTVLVLVGRSDDAGGATWHRLVEGVARRSAPSVTIAQLGRDSLARLVSTRRPRMTEEQIDAVVTDLEVCSGGLPGIATPLIDALDEVTLALPSADAVHPGRTLEAAVRLLGADARTVGGVGAVIGPQFDVSTVVELAPMSFERALSGIDELVRRGFVVERSVTEFALTHVLVQSAFLESESRARVASWHRKAAERWRGDLHRSARHAAAAVPLVAANVAAQLLERSAQEYLRTGLARSATRTFRAAQDVAGHLTPLTAGAYARALDLAGATEQARAVRQAAFQEAVRLGTTSDALRIATSGLPEAEPIDGDPTVVANLAQIDVARLPESSDRWMHAYHLTRQLTLVGRLEEAAAAAADLPSVAATPEQRVDAALARRLVVSATSPPATRLERLDHLDADLVEVDIARMASCRVVRAIDLYESADIDGARLELERLREWHDDLPVWRQWHLQLLDAMATADGGNLERAKRMRRAAFEFAQRHGIKEGLNALLVADFVDLWLDRGVATLRRAVDAGAIDPAASVMMAAGAAVILAASGEPDAAHDHARRVLDLVERSPVSQGVAAVALVSPVLATAGGIGLVDRARALLERRGESLLVVGAGAASLGPIARYVAALVDDIDERVAMLEQGRRLADRSQLRLWQVVLRRDLAAATGSAVPLKEAAELAEGSELEALVVAAGA